jgi:hypothetical protein
MTVGVVVLFFAAVLWFAAVSSVVDGLTIDNALAGLVTLAVSLSGVQLFRYGRRAAAVGRAMSDDARPYWTLSGSRIVVFDNAAPPRRDLSLWVPRWTRRWLARSAIGHVPTARVV